MRGSGYSGDADRRFAPDYFQVAPILAGAGRIGIQAAVRTPPTEEDDIRTEDGTMILEQLVRRLESRVYDLGKHLWGEEPTESLEEQAYRLREALRGHYAALAENQVAAQELRDRLA